MEKKSFQRPGPSFWVFAIGCALFLLIRILVLMGAVDHVRHVGPEEYQYVRIAANLLDRDDAGYDAFTHLTGQKYTGRGISVLLKMGFSPTVSLKILALGASFVGFASLLFLIARKGGAAAGAVFGVLMVFPHAPLLKWSLTCWGGYPEAAGMIGLPIALWLLAMDKNSALQFFSAGLLLGLVTSFSISIIYIIPAILIMPLVLMPMERWPKAIGWCIAGLLVGIAPILHTLATGVWNDFFESDLFITDKPLAITAAVSWPEPARYLGILTGKIGIHNEISLPEKVLIVLGVVWTTLAPFSRKKDAGQILRWRMFFSFTLLFFFCMIPFFPLVYHLDIRHVLWLYVAGYACCAFLLTDSIPLHGMLSRPIGQWLWTWIRRAVLAALLIYHATLILPLVQPSELGILSRYRGFEYYKMGIQHIVGNEVDKVNCLLDQSKALRRNADFDAGFSSAFAMIENHNRFLMDPYVPSPELSLRPPPEEEPARSDFFRGLGCSCAVKKMIERRDLEYFKVSAYSSIELLNEEYDRCMMLLQKCHN